MAWHLRKKPSGIKSIPKVRTIKPIKPIKPIEPIRPIKPVAPVGYQYYWRPDRKRSAFEYQNAEPEGLPRRAPATRS